MHTHTHTGISFSHEKEENPGMHKIINPLLQEYIITDVQNSLLDSVGEGEGGMIWENGIEICIIYETSHQSMK